MNVLLDDVSMSYQGRHGPPHRVFDHLHLDIASGDRVGIIGPEGAGKSTLLQMVDGLHRPEGGRVVIDGQDIWAQPGSLPSLRSGIAYTFQFPEQQFFGETVFEELTFGLRSRGEQPGPDDARCLHILATVGLDPLMIMNRSPFSLSMGEARRLALASALVGQPRALLLDEPTAGLDAEGIDTILSLFRGSETKGMTVMMVSHDIDILAECVDRLVIMEKGNVADDGPVGEILTDARRLGIFGYDLPETLQLIMEMRRSGAPIPDIFYRREEAMKILKEYMTSGKTTQSSASRR
jgi:energy-coupling factor transport system ATP-binding protein